jgi:hypothetical protein
MTELFIITFAVVAIVTVARWIRPVRPITAFLLALLTGAWIWANLRNSGWQEAFNERTPEGLDLVTKSMFWQGWPLAPAMLCLIHGNRLRTNGLERFALVFDWLALILILLLARFVCERCPRRGSKNCDDTTRAQGCTPCRTPG